MRNEILTIKNNVRLSDDVFVMTFLKSDAIYKAGQFVELKVDGFTLRRPFGVYDCFGGELSLLYKVVGGGTAMMATLKSGDKLDVLTELGNGFDISKSQKPLLIGGGLGAAPLYYLAKQFNETGIKPNMLLAAKTSTDLVFIDDFKKVANVFVATDDGTMGYKGNVVEGLKHYDFDFDRYYACGSTVMLKWVKTFSDSGDMSMEARMACGFGACMGCSIMTTNGAKRVCKDGPVFDAKEIIFD